MSEKPFTPYVPADSNDAGVHPAGAHPRPLHVRDPGRGQRLPGTQGRHDDRGDVSGCGDRHGGPAPDEGLAPGGEFRPYGRLDRRVDRSRGDLHDPRIRPPRILEVQHVYGLPDRQRAHDRRRDPRDHVRHHASPRDGRGPGSDVPGIGGGVRDPQGGPTRGRGGSSAVQGHGGRRGGPAPRRTRRLQLQQRVPRRGGTGEAEPGATGVVEGRPGDHCGRRLVVLGAGREPRVHRCRLHHRAGARSSQLRRRTAGLGVVRPAAGVLPRAQHDRPVHGGRGGRPGCRVGRDRRAPVPLRRPPDRRRRDARRRLLHPVQDAEEPGRRPQARARRPQEVGRRSRRYQPHRPRHQLQVRRLRARRRPHL